MYQKLLLTFFFSLLCLICDEIFASEVDNGLTVVDRKPWKISWIKEKDNTWTLLANFEKGEMRTTFKKGPPTKGLGLSPENQPVKQEFEFNFGKKFTTTNCQYEQWEDGAKGFAFLYEEIIERDNQKFKFGTTCIIEEIENIENEIRYSMIKIFDVNNTISADDEFYNVDSKNNEEDDSKHLSDLPEFEQLVHKSLTAKLDLLMTHRDFIHKQSQALLEFMKVLEQEKDKEGNIPSNRLKVLMSSHHFPETKEMIATVDKMKNNFFLRKKIVECLTVLNRNNATEVNQWFEEFEKEILEEIACYEKLNISLSQYKFYYSFYPNAKNHLRHIAQMLILMNKNLVQD